MGRINQIQPSQNSNGALLSIAGQLAGTALGGPVGGAVGGMVGGKLAGSGTPQAPQATGASESDAMRRRIEQNNENNLSTLMQAEQTLPSLPEDMRQEYGPAIVQARILEQRKRGMV